MVVMQVSVEPGTQTPPSRPPADLQSHGTEHAELVALHGDVRRDVEEARVVAVEEELDGGETGADDADVHLDDAE